MRNYFNSMKKIKFSLFFLLSVFGLCAQSPILVLEAENADSIHSPARVKSGDGFSNGKYVGGNDRGSYLFFHNVTMEKAGTYEFKTYFNCNGVRRFTVKVNNYPEVECTVNGTAKWDTPRRNGQGADLLGCRDEYHKNNALSHDIRRSEFG